MDLDVLWARTTKIFPILEQRLTCDAESQTEQLQEVAIELSRIEIAESIYETIVNEIDAKLRREIVPKFWNHFVEKDIDTEAEFNQFQTAVHDLHEDYVQFREQLMRLEAFKTFVQFKDTRYHNQNEISNFNEMLKVTLLSQLPANFERIIFSFYNMSFKAFVNSHVGESYEDCSEDMEETKCNGCENMSDQCRCNQLLSAFNKSNLYLNNMSLLDRLSGFTLTKLIQERIDAYVQETCEGINDVSHIESLEKWLDTIVLNWLARIFVNGNLTESSSENVPKIIADFKVKLGYYLIETYANAIILQFFNIIVDYPESQPAIDDLKLCLEKLDLRQRLVKSLTSSLETRLLHPGVNTNDILVGYIAAIKAIRHLDSSGLLLGTITELVKQYMRGRSDTVRCVVTQLIEEGELAEELAKGEAMSEDPVSNVDEMANWSTWKPDPVDIDPTKLVRTTRSADIISMVVDLYGSKELFVTEYEQLLAERLLSQLEFDPEKEIRNLELLKLRFDETLLQKCEVMLKDISDSKRINAHIHNETEYNDENSFKIFAMVLSSQFWPDLKNDTFDIPAVYQEEFAKFTKSFESYKVNRTLGWRHLTGRVVIEVELGNRTLEFIVNPTQAVILHHFQNRNQWTTEELCKEMKLQSTILHKQIVFWQSRGLIKEVESSVFVLVEDSSNVIEEMHQGQECDDDDSTSIRSASDQREEELQVFWSYIVGMLTNLDSLPLDRIHQMLKMFASHAPGVEFTQEELKNFLQRKVREHKLISSGTVYHLPK
ncbi:Anaphase-promoting complex subunit 2 [Pseudolycoriella hygida]|uniref:Anaphase-promoting complex subunit 2 n=1 Tax=Pseudolycoriella hygida TaxID=35572 RepID=A0A9Q0S2I9_9DIPT|nr:Anaphase-promoting complex subunit 2 [Pseudolycoriella hygida]